MQQPKDFEILDNMAEIIMIENETGDTEICKQSLLRLPWSDSGRSCGKKLL